MTQIIQYQPGATFKTTFYLSFTVFVSRKWLAMCKRITRHKPLTLVLVENLPNENYTIEEDKLDWSACDGIDKLFSEKRLQTYGYSHANFLRKLPKNIHYRRIDKKRFWRFEGVLYLIAIVVTTWFLMK